ncbi:serine/threonine-protein kinase [Polyangium aurulentum]|uniref:serine/threonine-protein kinase n=1 Tax=Polyangium aurulentum TaxID=2567896 RepID=UPI001469CC4F|nr:serine/threonine-protein kinase [Polyangium aurulentum]UQA63046.1 protein kinase [Polyangium aurulentum]
MGPGTRLGERFELVRLAGAGAMGEVYKAKDLRTGEPVAVKLLAGGGDEARFEREIALLASLVHPGIVRHLAHGHLPAGGHYLVMEWLEGDDLGAVLGQRSLTVTESLAVAGRLARALGFAHERGVVHRDLKPSNVFLVGGAFDEAKILDFGIAKQEGRTALTGTGALVGTPGYMAPEQARGELRIDARADVFSLGCVLFECLAGEPAFRGDHLMAILFKIVIADPPRLEDLRPDLPESLTHLVSRMMAKDPDERPRDGHAVAEALALLGSLPEVAEARSAPDRNRPARLSGAERRPVAVILIGAPPEGNARGAGESDADGVATDASLFRDAATQWGARGEPLLDGSIALWVAGTGMATDIAARAAQAALALRTRVPERSIALAVGRAALSGRMPLGDVIDRVARTLAHRNAPRQTPLGPVAVEETTAGLLDARFDVREDESGYWLHGERALLEGTRTLLGKPTACVGRDREKTQLEQLFEECVEESIAQAVLVTAAAGMGKSRLAHELVRKLEFHDAAPAVWITRGDPLRTGSAFALCAQILHAACGIQEGEPLARRQDKLLATVSQYVPEAERQTIAELLGEIAGAPFPDEGSPTLREARKDPGLLMDWLHRAFVDFLSAACAARPVLLVLEDLHWGDLPSVRLFDVALRDLQQKSLLILALARPEVHDRFPRLWVGRHLQAIQLKELSRKASERLVRQVLGEGVGAGTIERIVAQAGGNAFYLEELIRAASEGRDGELPETVVAMVQSRLGALDDEDRKILRAASIFGETFPAGGVAELLGTSDHAGLVRERLATLAARELLTERPGGRFPGEHELSFRHALLADGAYAMLTEEDRVLGHRLAGAWLEAHGERDGFVLARHFDRGEEGTRAARHYLAASEGALISGDMDAALAGARRGLELSSGEERGTFLGLLCEVHAWMSDFESSVRYGREAARHALPGSVAWQRGMLARLHDATHGGDPAELPEIVEALRTTDPTADALVLSSFVTAVSAIYLLEDGHLALAARLIERMDELAAGPFRGEPIPTGWSHLAHANHAYAALEDPWTGHLEAQRGLASIGGLGHARYEALAGHYVSAGLWYLGAHHEARRNMEARLSGHPLLGTLAGHPLFCLAGVLVELGALDEAKATAERLIAFGKARGVPTDEGLGRWALASALLRAGELDAAEREAGVALEWLARSPVDQPGARATLAAILLAAGRHDEALDAAARALAQYEAQRVASFLRGGTVHLVHAQALVASRRHDEARAAIARAEGRLLAIASKIGDPGRRKTFLEDVPENAATRALAQEWSLRGSPRP